MALRCVATAREYVGHLLSAKWSYAVLQLLTSRLSEVVICSLCMARASVTAARLFEDKGSAIRKPSRALSIKDQPKESELKTDLSPPCQ
uniref:Secreted protein n=1 Tax=Steinernema glaseri TaxID=37863 RepID=A0A1I8AQV9_9BILA